MTARPKQPTQPRQTPTIRIPLPAVRPHHDPLHQLVIHNIPYEEKETPEIFITKIASIKEIPLNSTDFTCFRALNKQRENNDGSTAPVIIVTFANPNLKNQFKKYQGPITAANIIPASNNSNPIYINENLPKAQRVLFHSVRQFAKTHEYKHAWTRDGEIYIRKDDTAKVHNITNEDSLTNLLQHH